MEPSGLSVTERLFAAVLTERFWSKVVKDGPVPPHCPELGPCWLWQGRPTAAGYGALKTPRPAQHTILAHRISYELHVGAVPDGLCVLHRCDTPLCVNPSHLFVGTRADNNEDKARKGRARTGMKGHPEYAARGDRSGSRTHPQSRARGEQHARAKLTENDVRAIRHLAEDGHVTLTSLSQQYGVGLTSIRGIVNRVTWRHLAADNDTPLPLSRRRRGDLHPTRQHPEMLKRGDDNWTRQHPERFQGEGNSAAKLTEDDVRAIRRAYAAGGTSLVKLGDQFGVTNVCISHIVNRKTWQNVPD